MSTVDKNKKEEMIDLTAIWNKYKPFWWVFLISIIGCVGLSLLYLKIKSPVFLSKTLVMVNQEEEEGAGAVGGLGALMSSFSLGGGSGSNVEDEMYKMTSHTNMVAVIKHLELNKNYWSKPGIFDRKVWY
ncbi:MAG: Wzz/FepE/Etk N-terminal domain-containing protein, partial [Muribaculaceae bacterium]|nr:Wzz/FepE/Etk N-terminal domain-containing protein [Muribaculaceae bacterium]